MKISTSQDYDTYTISFNDTPHLTFLVRELVGYQTWRGIIHFGIEITFKTGATITCEYDDIEKWLGVIDALQKIDIPAV